MCSRNIPSDKAPSRVYGTSLGKDSPVKIAQLKKPREPQSQLLGASGESRIMTTELNSFKEEMKNTIKEMNKNITQNVSTNVSATVNAKLEELENKVSPMFTEYKTDIQALRAEVNTAKGDLNNVTERVIALEHSTEFNSGLQKENDEKQSRNLNKIKAEIDTKIKELNQKLLLMEKHERKYNLLFYEFAEEKRGKNVFDKMRNVFVEDLIWTHRGLTVCILLMLIDCLQKEDGSRPLIMRFAAYEDRELVLSNAYKLAGSKGRILSDLPVVMKKQRGRLAKEAYTVRHEEGLQSRIKDKGVDVYLEVRKETGDRWVKRVV